MLGLKIFLIVVIVVMIGSGIWSVYKRNKYDDFYESRNACFSFLSAFLVFLILLFVIFVCDPTIRAIDDTSERYQAMLVEIDENADVLSFYVDGNLVEYENIDITQYEISYDKENGKVFLTYKQKKSGGFVPFFIPFR